MIDTPPKKDKMKTTTRLIQRMSAPRAMLNRLAISHYKELIASGLTEDQIRVAGHRTLPAPETLALFNWKLPALSFRYRDLDGNDYSFGNNELFIRCKPDYRDIDNLDSDFPKYLSRKGSGSKLYFSALLGYIPLKNTSDTAFESDTDHLTWRKIAKDHTYPIYLVEGEKKADLLNANGYTTIGLTGVYGWKQNSNDVTKLEADYIATVEDFDQINWRGRDVYIVFDSDMFSDVKGRKKPGIIAAARQLSILLSDQYEARVHLIRLPLDRNQEKLGVDDFHIKYDPTWQHFERLRQYAPPAVKVKNKKYSFNTDEVSSNYQAVICAAMLSKSYAFHPLHGIKHWTGKGWEPSDRGSFDYDFQLVRKEQHWEMSFNDSRIGTMSLSYLTVTTHKWDNAKADIFSNGTLYYDGLFLKFTPEVFNPKDYLTSPVHPFPYDVNAKCPKWVKFINEALGYDKDLIELLRAWYYYILMPKDKNKPFEIEKCLDLYGKPGTGKSTALEVLIGLVGSDGIGSAHPDTFKDPIGLGSLIGKRLAIDTDVSGFVANATILNKLISNEEVQVKKLFKDVMVTRLGVVIVRAYNRLLNLPEGSEGLARRVTVLHFDHQPEKINTMLKFELAEELAGIFQWVLKDMDYQKAKQIIMTADQLTTIQQFSFRNIANSNKIYLFLLQKYPEGEKRITSKVLYSDYQTWCAEAGITKTAQRHKFIDEVQRLGVTKSLSRTGTVLNTHNQTFWDVPAKHNLQLNNLKVAPEVIDDIAEG